jgi:hypothetical protein
VKGFGCRPVIKVVKPCWGPAFESLRRTNARGLASSASLWGFDWAAGLERDGPGGVIEGGLPGTRCPGGGIVQRGVGRCHGVAVLTLASGAGGARGAPPRPKLSTMIMRPPQQGHDGQ